MLHIAMQRPSPGPEEVLFNGILEVKLTTGLGQQCKKMTRCLDKMCFLEV